jgi:S-adenosylmethionine decarboxylase
VNRRRTAPPSATGGRKKAAASAGVHCLLDLLGCPPALLDDPAKLRDAIRDACDLGGLRVLRLVSHRFRPHGVTALALLTESHLSIHTWPERAYAAVDLFTCGDPKRVTAICRLLRERLGAASCRRTLLGRGPAH